jgi:hypothetical protein
LVAQLHEGGQYLCGGQTAQRHVFQVSVEVGRGDEGVVVTLDDEVEINVLVVKHEVFELLGDKGLADACRTTPEIAEV